MLQGAARAQDDVAAFAVTFDKALTAMLGDPNEPGLSVAIFLKCDDSGWRTSSCNAARQAVHDAVWAHHHHRRRPRRPVRSPPW
ncbi:hypothetical protein [Micromonospora chokoriensis]|uniref:Uncharacterized protein n=1 Tax=Micromonospora chokoriensis TaxID=356851 RepID=A0A1C4X9F5_9ACTN|nr:hypothetical protein [Micromonospora chokoriensis]SCF05027.1 hypothetical protein GA0070612_3325 [Micromonospora chokoriensis]